MENRIKEHQLDLFADRTSAATLRANQLRLWFASLAYVLLEALRRIGLRPTQFASATCGTIRLKLLKIGAQVRVSVRRIKIAVLAALRRPPTSSLARSQASGLPLSGRVPPRLSLPEARRLLNAPAYRRHAPQSGVRFRTSENSPFGASTLPVHAPLRSPRPSRSAASSRFGV
jgi:hypothetical protein